MVAVTNRAVVLIGVRKSGSLPVLQAVETGIARMKRWATRQGLTSAQIATVSDSETGEVTAADIYQTIQRFVDAGNVEQLIIYYAGHGINNGLSEYWLLSGAPDNPNEAINVDGSALLAERSGIPHVALFSDACRTAPEGIQALAVTGSQMFPSKNPPLSGQGSVDIFYACRLGDPAHEIKDPESSSGVYKSVYTEALVDALSGKRIEVLEPLAPGTTDYDVVRPWGLKRHLSGFVTSELKEKGLWLQVSQEPFAKLTSDPETIWLSRLEHSPTRGPVGLPAAESDNLASVAAASLHMAIEHGVEPGHSGSELDGADLLDRGATAVLSEFGPNHFETRAGFKIRNNAFTSAFSTDAGIDTVGSEVVRVVVDPALHVGNVALRFASGTCAVIPAVEDFMCALTFDGPQLIDIGYEPMDTSWRWEDYESLSSEIRRTRAAAASASRLGVLSLSDESALSLARHLQKLKGLDPALALYAAYAYHDLGRRDLITEMALYLFGDLAIRLYDVELLGRGEIPAVSDTSRRFPPFPMMSRGWSIAAALGSDDPTGLAHSRIPSLWTLFEEKVYDRIRQSMSRQEIR